MSDNAPTPEVQVSSTPQPASKRKASTAGLNANGGRPAKAVKRRASKACQCCRARKVRCNVVEHGAPCTNCRLDEIECIVSESKRKKKWTKPEETHTDADPPLVTARRSIEPQNPLDALQSLSAPNRPISSGSLAAEQHVPHSIYQSFANSTNYMQNAHRRLSTATNLLTQPFPTFSQSPLSFDGQSFLPQLRTPEPTPITLPYYLKPIPPRIGQDELVYLRKKGALAVPDTSLRNELLRSYIEYCHPFMPLLDLHDFLRAINATDGSAGKISLFTFSAVMFVGTAYVDFSHLQRAGYSTRKEARKDFFQKTRLLYDFDYEIDRISLVQGLLLMTYWYETPDDQKDTWHYMGLAISLAHTIGLHRNPERSNMDQKRKSLWRRIWWSLYMRDRLIALGMRRPTRIKNEDYDVPMMTIDDFELSPLPDYITCVPADCAIARDVDKQRQLASMCIEKTKLCLCISQVLTTQYSVLNTNQGILSDEGNTRTTMMLLPKKLDTQVNEIQSCDDELQRWSHELPEELKYRHATADEVNNATSPIIVNRAMLHLVFYCALSALHRPQVLPSMPSIKTAAELLDVSRRNVRCAANEITDISQNLYTLNLVKYLPTTGVTVLLPAIIIHLLDIKAPNEETRRSSLRGFCQCMQVMSKLRDNYAAADYSTAFLEAAISKAEVTVPERFGNSTHPTKAQHSSTKKMKAGPNGAVTINSAGVDHLVAAGHHLNLVHSPIPPQARTLTPPPDLHHSINSSSFTASTAHPPGPLSDDDVAARLNSFLASTPPDSSSSDQDASLAHLHTASSSVDAAPPLASTNAHHLAPPIDPLLTTTATAITSIDATASTPTNAIGSDPSSSLLFSATTGADWEPDFDSLLDVDGLLAGSGGGIGGSRAWGWGGAGDEGWAMQGESSGFALDMDFVQGMGGGVGEQEEEEEMESGAEVKEEWKEEGLTEREERGTEGDGEDKDEKSEDGKDEIGELASQETAEKSEGRGDTEISASKMEIWSSEVEGRKDDIGSDVEVIDDTDAAVAQEYIQT
ncbi:MAG: hypothetical protein M1822_007880 [Bathelium mastoideum]|nr:MAG: hypothetical protein M1822_007880 [Bathelium mastoideum]